MPAKWWLISPIAAMGLGAPAAPTMICISPHYEAGRVPMQANWSRLFNS
jgi:hypothetical protein